MPPATHVCHCGKSFLRKEHLRRHEATHQAPSFVCPECHRSFTRNDLLQRHSARHAKEASNATPSRRSRQACDACRANKTKCNGDGSTQCTLCAKRQVVCTYNGRSVVSQDGYDEDDMSDVEIDLSAVQTSSIGRASPQVDSIGPCLEATSALVPQVIHETRHQEPHIAGDDVDPALEGIKLLLQAIETKPESLNALLESAPAGTRTWAASCCKTYVDEFHASWPFIHMETLDLDRDPIDKCISVIMVGCWLRRGRVGQLAIEPHKRLMDEYFDRLTRRENLPSECEPWQLEKYQAILLNIIFALYTESWGLIQSASLLLGLFIATMRQIGIFNAERAEYQEKTHFPGTFVPYLVSYRQGWIRLATYLFKTDTYISLILGQCPTIRPQELNIGLASTSAAYDAGGLGKLFKRLDLEPGGRDTARLCDVLRDPYLLTADMCLVEDVTLGLCGSLSWLWEYRNLARTQPNKASSESGSRLELMGRLAAWKGRLDHISFLLESAALSQDAIKLPLRAYCEPDSERSAAALDRVQPLITEALQLHLILSLYLHADIQALTRLFRDKRETSIVNNMSERWILACQWWRSADGKEASRLVDRLLNNSIDRQGDALPIPSPLLFITNHVIITFAEADEQFK